MAAEMIPAWVDGRLTQVEKLEVHQRGLRHKAVSVFVIHDGRILLQRRAEGKYHTPGLWANTCCTHPRWAEAPDACARRRLQEELGITGLSVLPAGQVEYRADVGGGLIEHEVVDVFLAPASFVPMLRPDPEEVADTRWVTLAELEAEMQAQPDAFTPWLHVYLADRGARIFGQGLV